MERLKFWGVMRFSNLSPTGFFTRSVGAYQRGSFCFIWENLNGVLLEKSICWK